MGIQSRPELAQMLSARMARTYDSLAESQNLEADTALVKTYLLEAHVEDGADPFSVLEKAFGKPIGKVGVPSISRTDDPSLGVVESTWGGSSVSIYVDYSNPRYWLAHSMSGSSDLDYCMRWAAGRSTLLDRAWLPSDLLERTGELGSLRGLGLDFDRRQLPDVDLEGDDAPMAFMKMQLWGNKSKDVLATLSNSFPHETTLSKVKVKHFFSGSGAEALFSIDDIKFDGKITARGNSFDSHTSLTTSLYRVYQREIAKVEDQYSIGSHDVDGHILIEGAPVNFIFERDIADLETFCSKLFSSSEPFRLWGSPVKTSENFFRVEAVDLHVGRTFSIEITPEWMRMYVPRGTCGNSVLRIYTNLQHYYDSRVQVVNEDGEDFFAFQSEDVEPVDRTVKGSRGAS